MGEESVSALSIFLNWFPMLLLIGVWIFFMMQMNGKNSTVQRNFQYLDDLNALTTKQVAALERIADALEAKNKPS